MMWTEISQSWQTGDGLIPYSGETAHMLDWVENPNGHSRHRFAYAGQFIVDLVEIEPNAVHQLGKPDDEIVIVVSGILEVTTDSTKVKQRFKAGEIVLFKAGWAGIYRVISDQGPFRELAIVPHNYFDASRALPVNPEMPIGINLPVAVGTHQLSGGTYLVAMQVNDRATSSAISAEADQVIYVLAGSGTLASNGSTTRLSAGSVVVLPKGFVGDVSAAADYQALTVRWGV
jgi:quercetin dioxygenase-like cupin family protein